MGVEPAVVVCLESFKPQGNYVYVQCLSHLKQNYMELAILHDRQ